MTKQSQSLARDPGRGTGPSRDETAVRAVIAVLGEALKRKDAAAAVALYGGQAVRYTLAPALQQNPDSARHRKELEDWFATFAGPIEQKLGQHEILVEGDLALVHGFLWMGAIKREGAKSALWFRVTWALQRSPQGWRIVHEHQSVPFYMDGSMRAAVDLEPGETA